MTTIYGIRNCDTMKKARKWLDDHGIDYTFHDYRKDGVPTECLGAWIEDFGYKALINRRGTTWRKLPDTARDNLDARRARLLMMENPSIIKRPVLEAGGRRLIGFDEAAWRELFS